jgi:hypothetical protein
MSTDVHAEIAGSVDDAAADTEHEATWPATALTVLVTALAVLFVSFLAVVTALV